MTGRPSSGVATREQLQSIFDSATSVYVLVDPMPGEPIPVPLDASADRASLQMARQTAWGRQVTTVPLDPRAPLAQSQHPYLVTLQGAGDEWLADTFDMALTERDASQANGLASDGTGIHRISWLQTSLFAEDLADVLASMLRVNTAAWTDARYMRLADRRVFDWLRHVVGDARVAAQFGRLRRWVYLDARGRIEQLTHADDESDPLRLTAEEWALFMQGERMHVTTARWLGELARSGDRDLCEGEWQDDDIYTRVVASLDRAELAAQRWPSRFVHPRDRSAWAALDLLHPGLERDVRVRTFLQAPPEEESGLAETMHALSDTLRALMLKGISS